MQGVVKFIKGCLLFSLLWGLFMWFCFWQKEGMEVGLMNNVKKGICITLAVLALAGCMHRSDAVKSDGRPHAPSGQASPGGTLGSGPVGQPQS